MFFNSSYAAEKIQTTVRVTDIGFETVRSHPNNIDDKLHVRTWTEAFFIFLGPK